MPITILITDDHEILRETWKFVLDRDPRFKVIATCSNGESAVEETERLRPQIVIMDVNLPGINGIEATRQIIERSPGTKVVGFSLHNVSVYATKMMAEGAMGFVTKTSAPEEMFTALLSIHNGHPYVCKEIELMKQRLSI